VEYLIHLCDGFFLDAVHPPAQQRVQASGDSVGAGGEFGLCPTQDCKNRSTSISAWRRIALSVPSGISSRCFGGVVGNRSSDYDSDERDYEVIIRPMIKLISGGDVLARIERYLKQEEARVSADSKGYTDR
jgi:hypothetical protein